MSGEDKHTSTDVLIPGRRDAPLKTTSDGGSRGRGRGRGHGRGRGRGGRGGSAQRGRGRGEQASYAWCERGQGYDTPSGLVEDGDISGGTKGNVTSHGGPSDSPPSHGGLSGSPSSHGGLSGSPPPHGGPSGSPPPHGGARGDVASRGRKFVVPNLRNAVKRLAAQLAAPCTPAAAGAPHGGVLAVERNAARAAHYNLHRCVSKACAALNAHRAGCDRGYEPLLEDNMSVAAGFLLTRVAQPPADAVAVASAVDMKSPSSPCDAANPGSATAASDGNGGAAQPGELEVVLVCKDGEFNLPGGRMQGREHSLAAALRKTREECGAHLDADAMAARTFWLSRPWPAGKFVVYTADCADVGFRQHVVGVVDGAAASTTGAPTIAVASAADDADKGSNHPPSGPAPLPHQQMTAAPVGAPAVPVLHSAYDVEEEEEETGWKLCRRRAAAPASTVPTVVLARWTPGTTPRLPTDVAGGRLSNAVPLLFAEPWMTQFGLDCLRKAASAASPLPPPSTSPRQRVDV